MTPADRDITAQISCPDETRWSHGHERTGDELRVRIHAHLRQHPNLTAFEIARVLQLPNPRHGGQATVRRQLIRMEHDGEAVRSVGPKDDGDRRPTARWRAT